MDEPRMGTRLTTWTDMLVVAYLIITAAIVFIARTTLEHWPVFVLAHLGVAALIFSLSHSPWKSRGWFQFLRSWYPVPLILVFYKEVEVFAAAFGNWGLTEVIQQWETLVFSGYPHIYLSEMLPWVFFSEYIHFCYFFHNIQILLIGGLFWAWNRLAFYELIFLVTATLLSSYLFYMLFPVDSPFYLAPDLAEPLTGNFFYELVHFVSDRGGARGGAFPSSHVSVSVTVWLVVWFRARRWAYLLTPITVGLIFATVYGRFHYVLDSIVGFALALSIAGTYYLLRHKSR
jgi:membrane-associated phospholipid phosphatase